MEDLLDHCPPVAEKAARGELVAQLNHTVTVNHQRWNIDLALGPPADNPRPPVEGERIRFAVPVVIEIAVEAKAVMTEHGKARHNRLRDLQAFHHHAHSYNDKVVAAAVIIVNVAKSFWSPTRQPEDITRHDAIGTLGPATVDLFRNLPLRHTAAEGPGLEAAGVLVVSHDNLGKHPDLPKGSPQPSASRLISRPPAPQEGDPLHYSTMLYRICTAYGERWG